MTKQMIKAVFFDLDGVLIDSEVMHQRITEDFLREERLPIPPERFYLLIGSHKSLNPWPQIFAGIDLPISEEEVRTRLRKYKQVRLAQEDYGSYIFPEVKQVLSKLKEKGLRIACASSSNMAYIQEVLDSKGLRELFDLIVTCDDFQRSKPAPDIYLHCLNHFQLPKQQCIVVEDSEIGIAAGKSAGLTVIARKDTIFHLNQSQADGFIDDLTGLLALL